MSFPYGPRLDARAYYRGVRALYGKTSTGSAKEREFKRRRDELNLTIDHKLGVDFPADRREAMWAAQQRIHSQHLPLVLFGFLKKALGSKRPVEEPLYRRAIRELGKVLSPEELSVMLDLPLEVTSSRGGRTSKTRG